MTEPLETLFENKLGGSLLDLSDAKLLKLELLQEAEAKKSLKLPAYAAGFKIPYFALDGKVTKFYRYRYLADTRKGFDKITQPKPLRYGQPSATINEVYFAPFVDWVAIAQDPSVPLIITEGELKAACATKFGYPTLGLGGVWCFMSKKNELHVLPSLQQFAWDGRMVYIVFDSDAATNPDIVRAEGVLSKRLLELGARVMLARLPANEEVSKVGLDDFILLYGAEELDAVLLGAVEFSPSQALHALNQRVVYVRDPGFVWDHELKQKLPPQSFTNHAFANIAHWEQTVNKRGEVTLTKKSAATEWLKWEHRSEVRGVAFAPGEPTVTQQGLLNTWSGWGIDAPRQGDCSVWHELLDHLFLKQDESRNWFEQWLAYPLQNPGYKLNTAVLVWGPEHGTGKTLIGSMVCRIYGKNSTELKDQDLDDGRFQWAENKQFALADDITARGDRRFMRRLMTMVTQKYIRLDPKFIPSYSILDTINYYITSNDPDALTMDDQDRRFFIHEVLSGKLSVSLRKRAVAALNDDEFISALWHHLLTVDTSKFDPTEPAPMTISKMHMQSANKSDIAAWVQELRINTTSMLHRAGLTGDLFTPKELLALYDPLGNSRCTLNTMSRELKRAGFNPPCAGNRLRTADGTMIMVYAIRNDGYWRGSAAWKEACNHYDEHHPLASKSKW
jgi:hypothetical protein